MTNAGGLGVEQTQCIRLHCKLFYMTLLREIFQVWAWLSIWIIQWGSFRVQDWTSQQRERNILNPNNTTALLWNVWRPDTTKHNLSLWSHCQAVFKKCLCRCYKNLRVCLTHLWIHRTFPRTRVLMSPTLNTAHITMDHVSVIKIL